MISSLYWPYLVADYYHALEITSAVVAVIMGAAALVTEYLAQGGLGLGSMLAGSAAAALIVTYFAAGQGQQVELRRGVVVALGDEGQRAAVGAESRRGFRRRVAGERALYAAVGAPQPKVGEQLVFLHLGTRDRRHDVLAVGRHLGIANTLDFPAALGAEGLGGLARHRRKDQQGQHQGNSHRDPRHGRRAGSN